MSLDDIIDNKLPSWKRWRADFAEELQKAECMERFAEDKQLPDGFEIRSGILYWGESGYDHYKEGDSKTTSLLRFRTMILATANRLGRPDKVYESGYGFSEVPDLRADWRITQADGSEFLVTVVINSPKGCKLDPRSVPVKSVWGKPAELHPECKAVLSELEELEAPVAP